VDFSFDDAQEALRELARKILGDLATPARLAEIEAEAAAGGEWFDRTLWAELARANLLGVALPEAHGGMGRGFLDLCLLLQEQGRAVAPVPLHPTLVAGLALAEHASEAQRAAWLPRVAAGDAVLALGLAEDGVEDLLRPETRATPDGGGWRLEGHKAAVSAAGIAERILVSARTPEGVGAFLVDPGAAGVELSRQVATHREPLWWARLSGVAVPEAEALPGADVPGIVQRAVAGLCAIQLGVSERALEMTADYGRSREQFGRPIGSFQAFHQRAGDAFVQAEAIRLTLWQAASRLERGEPAAEAVDMAKFWACEGGQFVGYAAQHLHGGIGMDVDYPLHRYYTWAKHLELSLGSGHRALTRLGAGLAETT